ncbi:MAG: alpha/beta hydrolase [Planctomycetes bacterium]|nr:alpha/beta hydrolase [Planctomycetota bacterium]
MITGFRRPSVALVPRRSSRVSGAAHALACLALLLALCGSSVRAQDVGATAPPDDRAQVAASSEESRATLVRVGDDTFLRAPDGVRVRYVDVGEGEPVVILHGLAASLDVWRMTGALAAIAEDHRVLALDVRGHGRSDKPHDVARYGDALVDDVIELLDALGIRKAHVVGYSMGGMIALALVQRHPERVASAVAGGFGLYTFGPPGEELLDRVAASLEAGQGFGPLYAGLSADDAAPPTPEQVAFFDRMALATNDALALAACCRGFRALALDVAELKHNRVPVLAFVGDRDGLYPDVEALADVMTRLEVEVVKDADHMGAGASPRFLPAVRDFLATHAMAHEAAEAEAEEGEVREPAGVR